MNLISQLLEVGITPAGLALGALIITWLFILFYLFPRLQSLDSCNDEVLKSLITIKDKISHVSELDQSFSKLVEQVAQMIDKLDTIVRSNKAMKTEQSEMKDDLKLLHSILVETRSIIKHVLMLNVMNNKKDTDPNSKLQLFMQYLLSESQYGHDDDRLKSKIDLLLDDDSEE